MLIREFKLFDKKILEICFGVLYDDYILFNKLGILKIEHDKHFGN